MPLLRIGIELDEGPGVYSLGPHGQCQPYPHRGCGRESGRGRTSMATQDWLWKQSRVANVRSLLEEGHGLSELYAPHSVSHRPWDRGGTVQDGFGDVASAFPDMKISVEDAIENADKVVIRWRMRATHSGEFLGIQPTQRPVDFTGINIYRFVGDKIVEAWGEIDFATLSQQIFLTGLRAD